MADRVLEGQVVLIDGASRRGLGAVTAKLFAAHGARVVVNFRTSREAADQVVSDIQAHGGQAMAVQCGHHRGERGRGHDGPGPCGVGGTWTSW
ncbi:MAG: SDR family NAD(P)-dependent oxidoreductase [Flavobacteriales bacterium]